MGGWMNDWMGVQQMTCVENSGCSPENDVQWVRNFICFNPDHGRLPDHIYCPIQRLWRQLLSQLWEVLLQLG